MLQVITSLTQLILTLYAENHFKLDFTHGPLYLKDMGPNN